MRVVKFKEKLTDDEILNEGVATGWPFEKVAELKNVSLEKAAEALEGTYIYTVLAVDDPENVYDSLDFIFVRPDGSIGKFCIGSDRFQAFISEENDMWLDRAGWLIDEAAASDLILQMEKIPARILPDATNTEDGAVRFVNGNFFDDQGNDYFGSLYSLRDNFALLALRLNKILRKGPEESIVKGVFRDTISICASLYSKYDQLIDCMKVLEKRAQEKAAGSAAEESAAEGAASATDEDEDVITE